VSLIDSGRVTTVTIADFSHDRQTVVSAAGQVRYDLRFSAVARLRENVWIAGPALVNDAVTTRVAEPPPAESLLWRRVSGPGDCPIHGVISLRRGDGVWVVEPQETDFELCTPSTDRSQTEPRGVRPAAGSERKEPP
jgi:hypothetical protein